MKKIAIVTAFISILSTALLAKPASTGMPALSSILTSYFSLKNALVDDNSKEAGIQAGILLTAINHVSKSTLSGAQQKLMETISKNAKDIAKASEIQSQRVAFVLLSNEMYQLAKKSKLSKSSLFHQYCPMKKAYWLSDVADIQNPYYGRDSEMLHCGSVKETLK